MLAAFKRQHRPKLQEIAPAGPFSIRRDIKQLRDLSLPGLDELMAALEIAHWVEAPPDQCIVGGHRARGHTLPGCWPCPRCCAMDEVLEHPCCQAPLPEKTLRRIRGADRS